MILRHLLLFIFAWPPDGCFLVAVGCCFVGEELVTLANLKSRLILHKTAQHDWWWLAARTVSTGNQLGQGCDLCESVWRIWLRPQSAESFNRFNLVLGVKFATICPFMLPCFVFGIPVQTRCVFPSLRLLPQLRFLKGKGNRRYSSGRLVQEYLKR